MNDRHNSSARRRLTSAVIVAVVSVVWVSAGASSASAAGGIGDHGSLWGQINNLTPYTWTFVGSTQRHCDEGQTNNGCGFTGEDNTQFPRTVKPGQSFVYVLRPYTDYIGGFFDPEDHGYNFDGSFTYKADVVGGGTEYLTYAVSGCKCNGYFGNSGPLVQIYNTTAPPPAGYDPHNDSQSGPKVPATPNQQIAWSQADDYYVDATFTAANGNYAVDGSTASPQLIDLINAMCAGASGTTCSFKPSGPTQWGVGATTSEGMMFNCTRGAEDDRETDPDWFEVKYEVAKGASFSVGAGVSSSAELELGGIVKAEATIGFNADSEWENNKKLGRTTRVYVPYHHMGQLWSAPTEAKQTGTLVAKTGGATYTVTNFTQTVSGVAKNALTPDFNVMTNVRAMTDEEIKGNCVGATAAKAKAKASRLAARAAAVTPVEPVAKPAAASRLELGKGLAKVKLGQREAQVLKALGKPTFKSTQGVDCPVLDPRCSARAAKRGTWFYPHVSVVFGADRRAHTLIYRGKQRIRRTGVGIGSSFERVQKAYPKAKCVRYLAQSTCTVRGKQDGKAVKTVFHFVHNGGDKRTVDRVLIHLDAGAKR